MNVCRRLTCAAADHPYPSPPGPLVEGGHGSSNADGIRQYRRPEAPDASRECDPDLGAGPCPGTVQRHGHDEAGVSMQAGEGADRLHLETIYGKRLAAAFAKSRGLKSAELQEAVPGDFKLSRRARWQRPIEGGCNPLARGA